MGGSRVKHGSIVFTSLPIMAILRFKYEARINARLLGRTLDGITQEWDLGVSILPQPVQLLLLDLLRSGFTLRIIY